MSKSAKADLGYQSSSCLGWGLRIDSQIGSSAHAASDATIWL